jgi:hypothetical protein
MHRKDLKGTKMIKTIIQGAPPTVLTQKQSQSSM